MHPVTRGVLDKARRRTARWTVFRGAYRLEELRAMLPGVFEQAEVLVVPTMPTLPTLAEVQAIRRAGAGAWALTRTLSICSAWPPLAVPAGFTPRGLPGGITLIGPGGSEPRLCELGMAWQRRPRPAARRDRAVACR